MSVEVKLSLPLDNCSNLFKPACVLQMHAFTAVITDEYSKYIKVEARVICFVGFFKPTSVNNLQNGLKKTE